MSAFKIIHTSDWHLGKKLFKSERTEEHQSFLDWLYNYIMTNKINLLMVAGDIFDVPSPPNSAQKMLYDFIFKLGSIKNFETVIITGNHDSASLFEIPKAFFKQHNCSVYSHLEQDLTKLEHYIEFENEKIGIKLLPYFRNFELINHLENTPEQSIETFFNNFFSKWSEENIQYRFLMAHHGFGKYSAAGSEHAIFLSGLDYFPLSWVQDKFEYVALGHIHKKQRLLENPPILYTGSPLPLRFSEKNKKFVSEIVLEGKQLTQRDISIPIFKRLTQVKTNFEKYVKDLENLCLETAQEKASTFLEVFIEFDQPVSGTADHIRKILEGTNIELLSYIPSIVSAKKSDLDFHQIKQLDLNELFEKYYKHKFDSQEIPTDIFNSFKNLLEEIKHENTKS